MEKTIQIIHDEILKGKYGNIVNSIENALEKGIKPRDMINNSISPAMSEVISRFSSGKVYFPDLLLSSKTMKAAIHRLDQESGMENLTDGNQMMIMTLEDPKKDLGKYLVSIIAESMGIEVIDPDGSKDKGGSKNYNENSKPLIIGLSGQPSNLTSKASIFNTILAGPEYKDKASFIVFSPPVTSDCKDRMRVDLYSDFSIKVVKDLLGVLEKSFSKIKIDK